MTATSKCSAVGTTSADEARQHRRMLLRVRLYRPPTYADPELTARGPLSLVVFVGALVLALDLFFELLADAVGSVLDVFELFVGRGAVVVLVGAGTRATEQQQRCGSARQ